MERHVVTGAFGYSGKYIAQHLLDAGVEVHTLTNSMSRNNPFGGAVTASQYHFDDPANLVASLKGTKVLYNTYWVRFNHAEFTQADAVKNTMTLFAAAREAGVKRVVHVSITNPSEDSPLEYFRGKAQLERSLKESGLSYAILRPAVLFGKEDVLINNIAWFLRRFPVFGVFGDGRYKLQPVFVDDLAKIAVQEGRSEQDKVINVIGPETFSYRGLVTNIAEIIQIRRLIIPVPPLVGYLVGLMVGRLVGDVFITRAEIAGLMQNLLYTSSEPIGETKLTQWARENASTLGRNYASELARRRDRNRSYDDL